MKLSGKKALATAALVAGLAATPTALSHLDTDTFMVSYRQSLYAIVGANFGPMASMMKGEIPWDDAKFQRFANNLALASRLDFMRGFADANQPGQTRAKPELWENRDDFKAKLEDFRSAAQQLAKVSEGSDKKAIMEQFKATGGTCKACHDEYKAKDYIN